MSNIVVDFIWQIGVKKAISRGVQLVLAYVGSTTLENMGIKVDQNQLTLAVFAGLEFVRNYAKTKWKLSWL